MMMTMTTRTMRTRVVSPRRVLTLVLHLHLLMLHPPVLHPLSGLRQRLDSGTHMPQVTSTSWTKNPVKTKAVFRILARVMMKAKVLAYPKASSRPSR